MSTYSATLAGARNPAALAASVPVVERIVTALNDGEASLCLDCHADGVIDIRGQVALLTVEHDRGCPSYAAIQRRRWTAGR